MASNSKSEGTAGVTDTLLKRRLSEKVIRAATASYRAFRATVKEGQSMELSNVPRVFATKQTTILSTQQQVSTLRDTLAEIDELYTSLLRQ